MADPFTMAAAAGGMQVGGGLLKAFGESEKGEADARMYSYRAGLARMNANIQRQNSDYALTAGESNAKRSGLTTGFTIARQKVAQSSNGFDVNSGSNLDVRESTRDVGVVDQTTIRTNAGRQALSFRNAAIGLDAEAAGMDMAATQARRASRFNMISTLIGAAGSVASKWTQASQTFGSGSSGGGGYDASGNPG